MTFSGKGCNVMCIFAFADPEWLIIEIDGLLSVLEATDEDGRAGALEWAAAVVLPAHENERR